MKDPAVAAEAKKMRLELAPTVGDKLQAAVRGMIATDATVLARIRAMIEASNASSRGAKKKRD